MAGAASAFRSNAPILPNPNAPRDDEETQPMADRDVTRQRGNATRAEERMAALERENKSLKTQLGQVADTVSGLRSAINRTIANTAVSEEVAASGGEGKRLESVKAFISDGLSLTMVREGKFVAVKFDDEEALRVVKAVFTSPGQKLIGYPVLKERILGVQAILKREHSELRRFFETAVQGSEVTCEAAPYHPVFEYIAMAAMLHLADIQVPFGTFLCAVTFRAETLKAVNGKTLEFFRDHPMQCPAFSSVTQKLCKHFENNAVHRPENKHDLYGVRQMVDEFYNEREREGALCGVCDVYHKKEVKCPIRFAA